MATLYDYLVDNVNVIHCDRERARGEKPYERKYFNCR